MAADWEGLFERAGRPGAPGLAEPASSRRAALAAALSVYWPLQSIAMGRALCGLAKCPHFWAKTLHRV
jgi:hypothetical protein